MEEWEGMRFASPERGTQVGPRVPQSRGMGSSGPARGYVRLKVSSVERFCMAGSSKTTTDHKVIQKWAEERGGKAATVKRTEKGGEPGVLRINFPGYSGENSLEEISWDDWFQKFDEKGLAFLYQDETSGGEQSRFFKLVSRETAEHKDESHKSSHGSKSHA
jgi:hypothetical protein